MKGALDAGLIIHFSWIDHLDLLDRVFEEVFLPPAVRDEVLAAPRGTLGLGDIQAALDQGWLQVREPGPSTRIGGTQSLELGETEALRLAESVGADVLVTDDAGARRLAVTRGMGVIGTVGVLRAARIQGLVPAVLPLVLELRRLGQWIGEDIVHAVRREEGIGVDGSS